MNYANLKSPPNFEVSSALMESMDSLFSLDQDRDPQQPPSLTLKHHKGGVIDVSKAMADYLDEDDRIGCPVAVKPRATATAVVKPEKHETMPDVTLTSEFTSLMLNSVSCNDNGVRAFQLIDSKEKLRVSTEADFISFLGCGGSSDSRLKVVSIIGNTGDGKSHTLNHCFFGGREIFTTSSEQESCTAGVWAAYEPRLGIVCLDTEGLMGSASLSDSHHRTRLLVKILGVSDVVIFRTRSDRLHENMYRFLGNASRDYATHLQASLEAVSARAEIGGSLSVLGPSVLIFHETRHTKPLRTIGMYSPEDQLRRTFQEMSLSVDAFSSLRYIGQQTCMDQATSYTELYGCLKTELANTAVRSPRSPTAIFHVLKALNDRFNGRIPINTGKDVIPDSYFTCPSVCLSCSSRCDYSMGHLSSGVSHHSSTKCRYQHQYENIYYVCKTCHTNGKEIRVIPRYSSTNDGSWFEVITKYAWSGYVIECPNCGEIYRSRQYWYGNPPEDVAVRSEIHHIWPGMKLGGGSTQNSAQRVLDSVSYIKEAVVSASHTPTKALSSWVTDQVAPKYWRPNSDIKKCEVCQTFFTGNMTKHHCRMCGEGVCVSCSSGRKPVPEKGWYNPVRVCDNCFDPKHRNRGNNNSRDTEENEVIPRKVSEAVVTTISTVASLLSYPTSVIKETARPAYWVPDSEARECCVCSVPFASVQPVTLHHCRSCGGGVCDRCSTGRKPVPHRGWDTPVRVCDNCHDKCASGF